MEIKKYEEDIKKDLHRFLVGVGRMDEKMPECPDLECISSGWSEGIH